MRATAKSLAARLNLSIPVVTSFLHVAKLLELAAEVGRETTGERGKPSKIYEVLTPREAKELGAQEFLQQFEIDPSDEDLKDIPEDIALPDGMEDYLKQQHFYDSCDEHKIAAYTGDKE